MSPVFEVCELKYEHVSVQIYVYLLYIFMQFNFWQQNVFFFFFFLHSSNADEFVDKLYWIISVLTVQYFTRNNEIFGSLVEKKINFQKLFEV